MWLISIFDMHQAVASSLAIAVKFLHVRNFMIFNQQCETLLISYETSSKSYRTGILLDLI